MFTELTQILRKGDTLALTISREADKPADASDPSGTPPGAIYRVNIMPKLFSLDGEQGADRKALNTPLSIVATAAELDSPEFVATLNRFTASVNSTRHGIEDVEATHKALLETKKNSNAALAAKRSTTAKPAEKKPESKPAAPESEPAEVTEEIL